MATDWTRAYSVRYRDPAPSTWDSTPPDRDGDPRVVPPLDVLRAIYRYSRGEGAVIAIGSRRPPKEGGAPCPHYLTALDVTNWQPYLPALIAYGDLRAETLYYCVNPLSKAAIRGGHTPAELTEGVLRGDRPRYLEFKNRHVIELGAIALDLDVGRERSQLTAGQALGLALGLALDGHLPLPSLGTYTGRGAMLYYLLTDQEGLLPEATPEAIAAYRGSQEALIRLTAHLDPDRNATRLANWYKLPGTLDTSTGRRVVCVTLGVNGIANVPIYDLGRLAEALGVEAPEHRQRELSPRPPPGLLPPSTSTAISAGTPATGGRVRRVKRGKGGEMWRVRYRELEALMVRRGGISQGSRHTYLRLMWLAYYTDRYVNATGSERDRRLQAFEDTMGMVRRVNREHCRPPLPEADLSKVGQPPGKYSAATIVALLGITDQEVEALGLTHLVPTPTRRARQTTHREGVDRRRQDRDRRQEAIDADIRAGMGDAAIGARHGVDRTTVYRRRQDLRRRQAAQAPELPLDGPEGGVPR